MRGVRVGIYLQSTQGEYVFTSFDTDDEDMFNSYAFREKGTYLSRCELPRIF